MAPVHICVWYDTEDFVHPATDEAALRIAQLHARRDVSATFKVVGEKARVLRDRGRDDVIAALAAHDIGYHTDLHSVHPVVTEYCEALSWEHGESLFRRTESQGLADVTALFGRKACTFGQAGAAWAPQMYPVLRQWGIPTYVDDGPWIGLHEQPFWYMGLLHVFRVGHSPRFSPAVPGSELDAAAVLHDQVRRMSHADGGVISIYYHPLEWVTERFWDEVNFSGGRNPSERAEWAADEPSPRARLRWDTTLPPLAGRHEIERRFDALSAWLQSVAGCDAPSIGCSELPALYPDRALHAFYSRDELVEATGDWGDSVGYVRVPRGWLSAGEVLLAAADLLREQGPVPPASVARVAQPQAVDGPHGDVPPLGETITVPIELVLRAAGALRQHCAREAAPTGSVPLSEAIEEFHSRLADPQNRPEPAAPAGYAARELPSGIPLGPLVVRPEEFLMGCIRVLRSASVSGELPSEVELGPTELAPAEHVRGGPDCFKWPCFAQGFDAPNVIAHARRQTWTLKPALLARDAVIAH